MTTAHAEIAMGLARRYAQLPQVQAVALAGSRAVGGVAHDDSSDIDLCVYVRDEIDLDARRAIVGQAVTRAEVGNAFWGQGDEWVDAATGIHVDVVLWDCDWITDQVARSLERHEAGMGYSTCFWHTVRGSIVLADPDGWFAALQATADAPYPEPLRSRVIALNHAVLREAIPAYAVQVASAARRGDLVSVNHRLAGLLASYFDVLFALNRATHPGEKRLVQAACALPLVPVGMADDVADVLRTAGTDLDGLPVRVDRLLDRLDVLLERAGAHPGPYRPPL